MDVEPPAPLRERLIGRLDPEMTGPPVEVGEITRLQALPTAVNDAHGQHGIEYETARRRQDESARRRPQRPQILAHALEVAPVPSEALRAEIVRYPAPLDGGETAGESCLVDGGAASPDHEAIARERPARELARVAMRLQNLVLAASFAHPVLRREPRLRHGEPLHRHRAPVFQAR